MVKRVNSGARDIRFSPDCEERKNPPSKKKGTARKGLGRENKNAQKTWPRGARVEKNKGGEGRKLVL